MSAPDVLHVAGQRWVVRRFGDRAAVLDPLRPGTGAYSRDHDPLLTAAWLRSRLAVGVDVVPGAQSVTVRVGRGDPVALLRALDRASSADGEPAEPRRETPGGPPVELAPPVVIPVVFDGPDLTDVAQQAGLTIDEVVAIHTSTTFTVRFHGFAPGFGYLGDLPTELRLPRRAEPRTSVPAGSVAIADRYCGIYPRASPGGWHLIGRTGVQLFDPTRDEPALLSAGRQVRFSTVAP